MQPGDLQSSATSGRLAGTASDIAVVAQPGHTSWRLLEPVERMKAVARTGIAAIHKRNKKDYGKRARRTPQIRIVDEVYINIRHMQHMGLNQRNTFAQKEYNKLMRLMHAL